MADIVLGVDPGLRGALAALRLTGEAVGAWPLPLSGGELDGRALCQQVYLLEPVLAVVEKAAARPGQGVCSMFAFGRTCGVIEGVLAALAVPRQLVTPQRWKKEVLAGTAKDKDAAIAYARKRFPSVPLVLPGCRVEHDGLADALCLAELARRIVLGEAQKTA